MSANHITDYLQLVNILEAEEKIVYLCGAGASMSLGSHRINWPGWILSGGDYLLPDEQRELEQKIGSWSTEELISAATYLLDKLKMSSKYQLFMDSTIGSLHPNNSEFKTALRLMWRAGDLIATTNYDLQIEEAISANGISYSSAGNILPIILGKAENRIIHLHGMYDKLHGIDDIVADDPQYRGVLANAGAQFIQNLISTHPIIITGCGGTVEDPNLAGFMSFVVDKLGVTDVPYFYVMKEGDSIPALPANTIPVYYGTEYEDLAVFLSELARFRLRKRINLKSIISVNPYQEHRNAVSAFGRMHFSSGFHAFIGRDREFAQLDRFLDDPSDSLWWGVTGAGGIGKSRLILEWLRRMPSQWFGFFIKKTKEAGNFIPFTDTVVVFDYILGEEKQCAAAIEALLEIFDSSPYKLRIIFIERNQQHTEDSWLMTVKSSLPSETRLFFEAARYQAEFPEINELSVEEEKVYVKDYLRVYLPLLPSDSFIEYCKNHITEVSCKIQESFRQTVDPSCYRPLYLSIFTEVWIAKEGKIVISSAEELLNEYLIKEKRRWKAILGEDTLVYSYMRLLAMACAIGRFNITDVMGENYLEDDCRKLRDFFERKSGIPGSQNVFIDLFVETDELVEIQDDETLFRKVLTADSENVEMADEMFEEDGDCEGGKDENDERMEALSAMDADERFAFSTPYIKLDADPEEVYLNMINNVGMAGEEEKLKLQQIRERRKQKYATMPDYAWILEPVFPDIIKEYIVVYVVNEREIVKFTKLARSNSVLELQKFLVRALEDWPSKELFEKMAVTPPSEILNYFEYYIGLLTGVSLICDFKPVEKALYDTDASIFFQRYEMELWRRMAIVLTDRGDMERLHENGLNFIEYVRNLVEHGKVFDTVSEVLKAYAVGLHNTGNVLKFSNYLEKCNEIAHLLPENQRIGYLCCENYGRLFHLRLYNDRSTDIPDDWYNVLGLLELHNYPEDMCRVSMNLAKEYLHVLIRKNDVDRVRLFEKDVEFIYEKCHIVEVVETAALAAANNHGMSRKWDRDERIKEYDKLKHYLAVFPDSMYVRSSYISVTNAEYEKYNGARDVPDKIMAKAKEWSEQYPDEIEFQEGYFGLLLSHLEYAQMQRKRNEESRTYKKLKALAEKTDYSAYGERNQLKDTVAMLQKFYGYK